MGKHRDPNVGISRHEFELPRENVGFDAERFDELLRSQGVEVEIFSAIICPLDAQSPTDNRHLGHACSNGFLYRCEGRVTGAFLNNNGNPNFEGYGIERDAMAYFTVPRYYDTPAGKPVVLGHYYRLYLSNCEIPVVNSEKLEHSPTGIDRPTFPPTQVTWCIDSRGIEYKQDEDFEISEGCLKWIGSRGPGFNADANRGEVLSIQYEYKPFFYIKSIPHEIRVARVIDDMSGEERLIRMPFQLVLEREWVHHDQNRVEGQEPTSRSLMQPRSGGFTPR